VLFVGLYAVAFAAGLWVLKNRLPEWRRGAGEKPRAAAAAPDAPDAPESTREKLLTGSGLSTAGRSEYFREIARDCCDCGCDLPLRECLLNDRKCARSSQLAKQRLESVE